MKKKELYSRIISYFQTSMPVAESELVYDNPFQLLTAVILSAQCTDKRVNMVTPSLFAAYPTSFAMSSASEADILSYIKSVSYPNSKAKHLLGMSKMLVEEYGGEVPDTLEALVRLPGVGRKTANVMQSVVWGKATMAVDTHVFRVSHRLGLVPESCNTPLKVELELVKHIADEDIPKAHHWLLLHGRYICQSRTPHCEKCGLQSWCKHFLGQ